MGGYSTGMKQRAKLAQALVHDPRLVLLDEPTNGLDPSSRDDMLALVRKVGHEFGIAVLVTSHLLGELERVSDHVVVLDGGRLLQSSATTDFLHATGSLIVEVMGKPDADRLLGQALVEAGLTARPAGGALIEVEVRDEATPDVVRDLTVDLGLGPGADAGAAPPHRGRLPRGRCRQCPARLTPRPRRPARRRHPRPRLPALRRPAARRRPGGVVVLPHRPAQHLRPRPVRPVEGAADDPAGDDAAAGADPGRRPRPGPRPARPRPPARRLLPLPGHHPGADLGLRRRPGARADLPRPAVPHHHPLPRPPDAALGLRAGAATPR